MRVEIFCKFKKRYRSYGTLFNTYYLFLHRFRSAGTFHFTYLFLQRSSSAGTIYCEIFSRPGLSGNPFLWLEKLGKKDWERKTEKGAQT